MHRYLTEFDFRYNHRAALGVNDDERTVIALKWADAKRLTYRESIGSIKGAGFYLG